MYRQTIEQAEEDKKRHTTVVEQYKKVSMHIERDIVSLGTLLLN